jgi:hypothetical protein
MDRSPIRETGSSDSNRPTPGEFADISRRRALEALLAKPDALDQNPAHRFWASQRADFAATERRIFRHYAPWPLRLRVWFTRTFRIALVLFLVSATAHAQGRMSFTSSAPKLTPQEAADIMRPHQYVAPPPAPDGPHVYVINSTPGAASWLSFPPERPRIRLDGTPITQAPTVYGNVYRHRR